MYVYVCFPTRSVKQFDKPCVNMTFVCCFILVSSSGYRVGGTLPSHGRMPRVSEETLPSPGSVKNHIASLERRISHQEAEDHARQAGQHRYRATLNYWKDLNNSQQFGPPGTTSSHSSSMSMDSTNSNIRDHRTSREIIDSSLQRLANERRSVRESRHSRPIQNTSQRLRNSSDELDRIGQSRGTPVESRGRHSRDISSDQSSRHSREDMEVRHSRESSLDVQQSSHSRENSLDDAMHDERHRGK